MLTLKTPTAKSLLLGTVMVSAMMSPLPALAQNACMMLLNLRSDDGAYRNALRVVRGGEVFFFRTDDATAVNPLTKDILRDKSLLAAWLMENAGLTANEAANICVEVIPASRKAVTDGGEDEEQGEEEVPAPEPEPEEEEEEEECPPGTILCGNSCVERPGLALNTLQQDNLTVADLDEAQRIAAYATL